MSVIQAILLGLVQGLTEFIPVSSSGHLLLFHHLFGSDSGLSFDVALHIGTFLALIVVFWRDIVALKKSIFIKSPTTRLAWLLVVATIPAVISGALLESRAESSFRSPLLVSVNLMVFAVVMLGAEHYTKSQQPTDDVNKVRWSQALIIGLAQAVAVIPGVSRSGSTITAGIFTGLDRVAATRFSFLLALPITLGAIMKVMTSDAAIHEVSQQTSLFVIGIITAFISGIFAIKFLLRFLSKHSLRVFAYYRLGLGALVLLLLALA